MNNLVFVITLLASTLFYFSAPTRNSLAEQFLTKDDEKIAFAQELLNKSQYQLAASQYEELIQQYPQSALLPNAYLGAGDSHFFLKEYSQAINFYQKYTELFAEGADRWLAFLRWGQCLYLTGQKQEALSKLQSINEANVKTPFVQTFYFFLGQAYAAGNDIKQASINYEKAVQDQGGYTAEIYLQWGNLLLDNVNYINAMQKYLKAFEIADNDEIKAEILMKQAQIQFLIGEYNIAAKIFKSIIDGFSSTSVVQDATVNWFLALLKNQQFDMLWAYYNQQFKDNFNDPAWVKVHLTVVEVLLNQKKDEDALAILNNLIAMPNIVEELKNKAVVQKTQILINTEKLSDAIAFIDIQTIEDKDTKTFLRMLKAQSQSELKDFDKAWESYLGLSQDNPDAPESYCGMAHVRYVQGSLEQAASLFMDCFNKSKEDLYKQDAFYNVYLMYQKAGLQDKATETALSYLQNYPQAKKVPEVILDMASLYSKTQKYDQAIDILKKLLDSSDEQYRQKAVFQTAYNLQLSGDYDQALKFYEQVSAGSTDPELKFFAFKNTAIIYIQKDSQDKAAEALDWIIQNFPPNDLAIKYYLWLAEYWQLKNNPEKMLLVLAEAQKRPAQPDEALGITFFLAEANRLKNICSMNIYEDIIKVNQNNPYRGRARLGKGMCLQSAGDRVAAQKELEQAIAEHLEDSFVTMHARFELARILEEQKQLDQAVKLYMLVALLYKDPEYSPQALVQAGMVLQNLNNNQEALNVYHQVLNDYPQSPMALEAKKLIEKIK